MIQYKSLNDLVYEEIKTRIIGNVYRPGEKLDPSHIRAELNVSRTPVINALKLLEREGFVVIHPRSGTYVREYSVDEIATLMDFRGAIESAVVRQAVDHADPEVLQQHILSLQEDMAKLKRGEFHDESIQFYYENQRALHQYLWTFCPNIIQNTLQSLIEMTQRIYTQHLLYSLHQKDADGFMEEEIAIHIRLAESLIRKNTGDALYYMQRDIERTKCDVINKFNEIYFSGQARTQP